MCAFYLHGIKLSDDSPLSQLTLSQRVNVNSTAIVGSDVRDMEITSMEDDRISFRVPLGKQWIADEDTLQGLMGQIRGLIQRLTPLHVHSEDLDILEGSKEAFIIVEDISYDYFAGRKADELVAFVQIEAQIVGTPNTMLGKYILSCVQRGSDFSGRIAPRSVYGLPKGSVNVSTTILENRINTPVVNLGHASTGFADDTLTVTEGTVNTGKVTFDMNTASRTFLTNSIKVYDDGYSPRKRVISRNHQFVGQCIIESDLYKIVIQFSTPKILFYEATSEGVYSGSVFERIVIGAFTRVAITNSQDEFLRIRFNTGEYLEIERGKDPVITLASATQTFAYEVNALLVSSEGGYDFSEYDTETYVTLDTQEAANYIHLGNNVYLASNRHFNITDGTRTVSLTSAPEPTDAVFAIIKSDVPNTGRNREILKELT